MNGSGGLVSKPNSVMNSGRLAGIAPPDFADRVSSNVPSELMFAIVIVFGLGSTVVGETFFVYG